MTDISETTLETTSSNFEFFDGHFVVYTGGGDKPENVRELRGDASKIAHPSVAPDGALTMDIGFDFDPIAGCRVRSRYYNGPIFGGQWGSMPFISMVTLITVSED